MFGTRARNINALRFQLAELLKSRLPANVDWLPLLHFANTQYLAPAIFAKLAANNVIQEAPPDVADYLFVLHELNSSRNLKLREQLIEAILALNRVDIIPAVTKGAIDLATRDGRDLGSRMMHDLDISVRGDEVSRAEECLRNLGYHSTSGQGWDRASECGSIDLHFPPGRYPEYWPKTEGKLRQTTLAGGRLCLPSNGLRAGHVIIHDMIKDGGIWLPDVNMRALHDLYQLETSPEGLDWRAVIAAMPDRLTRTATLVQHRSLRHYFNGEVLAYQGKGLVSYRVKTGDFPGLLVSFARASGRIAWLGHRARVEWRNRETALSLGARVMRKVRRRGRNSL